MKITKRIAALALVILMVTAFVSCAMTSGRDYVGELCFAYRRGKREWKDGEIDLMKQVARIIYRIVFWEKRK